MRRVAIGATFSLLLSGCSYQEVNKYSPFKCRASDDVGMVTLKTAGNLVPWTAEATAMGVVCAGVAAFFLAIMYVQGQRS